MTPAEVVERLGPFAWLLRDRQGRLYTLRTLTPEDAPALQAAFAAQAPEDRAQRLRSPMARLPDRVARRFCTVDEAMDVGLGLFPLDEPGRLVGGARVMRDGPGEPRGEFAVSVASVLKGSGLGRLALSTAIGAAREIGITRVWGSISRKNGPMRALAKSMGMQEKPDPDDSALVVAETTA
jgi:RimJ/RimL family protein N-acetyltransferase